MQPGSRLFPHLCALLLRTFIKFLPYEKVLLHTSNTDVYNETLREELKFKNLFFNTWDLIAPSTLTAALLQSLTSSK
jgi:hypothetical protein